MAPWFSFYGGVASVSRNSARLWLKSGIAGDSSSARSRASSACAACTAESCAS